MKKKLGLIIAILAVLLIISSVALIVWLNTKPTNSKPKDKETVEPEPTEEPESTEVTYNCYRHKDEDASYNDINYKYTKYYQIISKDNSVNITENRLVTIYKLASLEDYQNFDMAHFITEQYAVEKDETEKKDTYDLDTYLELLKTQGYSSCEKQK